MVKKICFVVICLLLAVAIACESKPKVDLKPIETQVQKEASEFKQALDEIVTTADSVRYLADVPIDSLIPKDWLYEISQPSGEQISVNLAIPVPKDVGRGLTAVRGPDEANWYYMRRGGNLDPDTELYIAPTWTGSPYNYGGMQGGDPKSRNYPEAAKLSCFKNEKVIKQPYMVPSEATHGVYIMSGPDFRKSRSNYNISQLLSEITEANPYEAKGSVSDYVTTKLPDVVKRFREQLAVISKDMDSANGFATALEDKYGKKSGSWTTHEAVESYKKIITENKAKLSQIEASLSKISNWDFTSLEKYRSLTTK
jgi:hypothetical protein